MNKSSFGLTSYAHNLDSTLKGHLQGLAYQDKSFKRGREALLENGGKSIIFHYFLSLL